MKKNTIIKRNVYWFFRSFFISILLMFCTLFLILGCAECYAVMHSDITGEKIEVIEQKNGRIIVLGNDICSAEFLPSIICSGVKYGTFE